MPSIFAQKAQSILNDLSNRGAPASATATPGPILQLIEQLITDLLPMLTGCIPTPTPAALLAELQTVADPVKGAGYRLIIGVETARRIRDGGEPTLNLLVRPIKLAVAAQCGVVTAEDCAAMMAQ